MENGQNVSLTISKEIVTPIVKAKIEEAIIAAMGGTENLIALAVNEVLNKKVNIDGGTSNYSSENKYTWLEVNVTKVIKDSVKESMKEMLEVRKEDIKKEMMKQLSSKKGLEGFVTGLLLGTHEASKSYRQTINVELKAN